MAKLDKPVGLAVGIEVVLRLVLERSRLKLTQEAFFSLSLSVPWGSFGPVHRWPLRLRWATAYPKHRLRCILTRHRELL